MGEQDHLSEHVAASAIGTPGRTAKNAVLVVHGIGSQSPMTTLRQFVEAVWTTASGLTKPSEKPQTWTKRDLVSGSYELRRITTNHDINDRRTDFFEFYWADMMEDTKLSSVLWWVKRLLGRGSDAVPPAVHGAWIVGRLVILALAAVLAAELLMLLLALHVVWRLFFCATLLVGVAALVAILLWVLRHRVLVEVVGDAARYLTADPQNIGARSRIRAAGMKLLAGLHDSPDYDRIILVCHSLGTVIGYDILNFYWSTVNEYFHHPLGQCPELVRLENCIGNLREEPSAQNVVRFQKAQRAYARVIASMQVADAAKGEAAKIRWKVTDFVTLGSPLTHAHFLMVDDRKPLVASDTDLLENQGLWITAWRIRLDSVTRKVAEVFSARAAQREFPLCPPLNEAGNSFVYEPPGSGEGVPHHAAVFGPVRWTNIFAPCRNVVQGDVIGGPVSMLFGPGVKDIELTGTVGTRWFAHTHYWDPAASISTADNEHLAVLQNALNLLDI